MNLGAPELMIILVIVLLIFGTSKLPKLFRSLGEAKGEFEKGMAQGEAKAQGETKADSSSSDAGTAADDPS